MDHFNYLIWLSQFVFLPIAVLAVFFRNQLKPHWKVYGFTAVLALIFSIPWDYLAIRKWHIWAFPEENLLGWYLFGIPFEEYLFIVFVTWLVSTITLILFHYSVE